MLVLMHLCNIQTTFHADRYLTLKSLYTGVVEKVSTYESLREPYIGFYPWICIMRETSDRCKHTLCDGITAPPSSSRTLSVSVESLMSSSSLWNKNKCFSEHNIIQINGIIVGILLREQTTPHLICTEYIFQDRIIDDRVSNRGFRSYHKDTGTT